MRRREEESTQRFQTKGTQYFCTKFAKMVSLLCDLLLQIARQRPYNSNTGKHNIKSKLSKRLKNPALHIDDIL